MKRKITIYEDEYKSLKRSKVREGVLKGLIFKAWQILVNTKEKDGGKSR